MICIKLFQSSCVSYIFVHVCFIGTGERWSEHDFMTLSLVFLTQHHWPTATGFSSPALPTETIYLITQRLPWRPSCHDVTRWRRSLAHLSQPCRRLAKQKWHRLWLLCDFSGTAGCDALSSLSGPTSHMTLSGCENASDCTNAQLGISQSVINVSPFLTHFAVVTLWYEIVTWSKIFFSAFISCLLHLFAKKTMFCCCWNKAETRESEIKQNNEPKEAKST